MKNKILLLSSMLSLAMFLVSKHTTGQINYNMTTFTGTYTPISTGGGATSLPFLTTTAGSDEATLSIQLPFAMNYNGTSYTTDNYLGICINGHAFFSATTSTTNSLTNTQLFLAAGANSMMAPWWDDLDLDVDNDGILEGSVLYMLTATNELTVQWTNVWSFKGATGSLATHRQLNFQLKLYGDAHATKANQIEFLYGSISGVYNSGESASIGIESAAGGSGNYIDATSNSKVVNNSMMNTQYWPAEFFRFTPSGTAPSALPGGTYTVGSTGDYSSLTQAFRDLNSRGISGTVTLDLIDNSYTSANNSFPLVLGPISGTSAANRIIIKSNLANGSTISSPGGGAGNLGNETNATTISGSTAEPILALIGTDYVKLENLTFMAEGGNTIVDRGITICNSSAINGATNDSLINIKVELNRDNANAIGILQNTITTPTNISGANSDNKYFNIRVTNAYSGILLSGHATINDQNTEIGSINGDTTIIGADLADDIGGGTTATYGIQSVGQTNAKISNTIVRNITVNGNVAVYGIWINEGTTATTPRVYTINNNRIYNLKQLSTGTSTASVVYGIRAAISNHTGSLYKIYNNFITGLNSEGTMAAASRGVIGINVATTTSSPAASVSHIDFNTVIINPSASGCSNACFQLTSATTATLAPVVNVRNNIFANYTDAQTGSFKHYCWASTSVSSIGGGVSNRNVLYVDNTTNGYTGIGNTTDFISLSNWKGIAANVDVNSRSENPQFISTSDYKIDPSNPTPVESSGSFFSGNITWAENDIEGNARNVSTPDIGAYEGTFTSFADNDIKPTSFASPADQDVIRNGSSFKPQGRFTNGGVLAQTNIPVRYRIIGPLPASSIVYDQTIVMASILSGATVLDSFPATTLNTDGTYTIELISELVEDDVKTNDTLRASALVLSPLAGNIPVGTASPFPYNTLTNAIKALTACGVSGATMFELTDASYGANETFPITISPFSGASAANQLTIKPASGVSAEIKGSSVTSIIRILDADYVTIDGSNTIGGTTRDLTITNDTALGNTVSVWISSSATSTALGATFDTLMNCIVRAGSGTITTTGGIYVAGVTIGTTGTGANNDNISIINNKVERSYRGITARGVASTGILDNLRIIGNEVGSDDPDFYVGLKGIEVTNNTNSQITSNKVYNLKPSASAAIGIELGTNTSRISVSRNEIDSVGSTGAGATGAYGIAITSATGVDSVIIRNNFIQDIRMVTGGTGTINVVNGIRVVGGSKIYIVNNSVNLNGSFAGNNSSSACLMITVNTVTGLNVLNNVFVNNMTATGTGAKSYALYAIAGVVFDQIDYNSYYTSAPASALAFLGTERTNMNQLRAGTGQDNNSFRYNANFTSSEDLHIPNGPSGLEGLALPLAYVTDDIDGDIRTSTPDIGADEFNGTAIDISPPGINFTLLGKTVSIADRVLSNFATIQDNSLVDSAGINAPRIYYKKSAENNVLLGNTSGDNGWKYTEATNNTSPFSFIIDYSLLTGGGAATGDVIQYFIVAQDLASTPNVGINGAELNSNPASVVLEVSDFPVIPVNSYLIAPALPLSINVGAGETYTSLTGAGGLFAAVNSGVIMGNTTVNITSDITETGTVALNEFVEDGAGGYTLSIVPDMASPRKLSGIISPGGLIQLNGADRVVFDGRFNGEGNYLTFNNTGAASRTAVFYLKTPGTATNTQLPGCENVTIRNVNIVGGSMYISTTSSDGVMGVYIGNDISASSVQGASFNNHNLTITGNKFAKMGIGIYSNGHVQGPSYNMVIDSNEFGTDNMDSTVSIEAIFVGGAPKIKIRRNNIHGMVQNNTTTVSSIWGMQVWGRCDDGEIAYNTIRNLRHYKGGLVYGMTVENNDDSIYIHNNVIEGLESSATGGTTRSVKGINFSLPGPTFVYHNSINLYPKIFSAGGSGAACIDMNSSSSTTLKMDIRNNNFVNTIAGGNVFGMYFGYPAIGLSDYNNIYVPNGATARISTGTYNTLADWQTTGQDAASFAVIPQFNNDSNLVLLPGTSLAGKGVYLPVVPVDIKGAARNNPPTLGAYDKPDDFIKPAITYTKLVNATANTQRNIQNFATITDIGSAVDTNNNTKPRIYFKRIADDNTFIDNTPTSNGWKYAEASGSGSPFSFTMDYSLLFGSTGISVTDTIQYFVVAQDTADVPNIAINEGVFTTMPASVNLAASAFPVTGNLNYFVITNPISGTIYVGQGGDYPNLTDDGGVFDVINNATLSGDIEIVVLSDLLESGMHTLNALSEVGAGYYRVKLMPVQGYFTTREISGNTNIPIIRFNGADRILIDGTDNESGAYLTFKNNGTGAVISFVNNSVKDTVRNIVIEGRTGVSSGLLEIRDNCDSLYIAGNTFTGNMTSGPGDALPFNAIYASGTVGLNEQVVIEQNQITNFFYSGINVTNTGNGSFWKISNNDIYYNTAIAADTSQVGINFVPGTTSDFDTISNNRIGGSDVNMGNSAWINIGDAAGISFQGIVVNNGSGSNASVVSDNSIGNIKLTGTTGRMSFVGIEQLAAVGGVAKIERNVIGDSLGIDSISVYGFTAAGASINAGIASASTGTRIISGNKISGISVYAATSGVSVRGVSISGAGSATVTNNIISGLLSASGSAVDAGSAVVGIYGGSPAKGQLIQKNTIFNLTSTGGVLPAGSASSVAQGIVVDQAAGSGRIEKNKIYNISNLSTGLGNIYGIHIANGTGWGFFNNQISLTNTINGNPVRVVGVFDNSIVNAKLTVAYNTVYVGGSITSGTANSYAFLRTEASELYLRNNIFYNERTGGSGRHISMSNFVNPPTANWNSNTSNYNLFVGNDTADMFEWGNIGAGISGYDYKNVSTTDGFSYYAGKNGLPSHLLFKDVFGNDLDINRNNVESWSANGKGVAIDTVAISFNDSLRSGTLGTPTDIGADEFTPNVAPPTITTFTTPGVATEVKYLGRTVAKIEWTTGSLPAYIESKYYSGVTPVSSVSGKSINSYLEVNTFGGGAYTCDVSVGYTPAEISTIVQNNLKVARTSIGGTNWNMFSGSVVNTTNYSVLASGLTQLGTLTLTDQTNPLPVQLTKLSATYKAGDAVLNWATASEINSDYFDIEKSSDGETFTYAGRVSAKGTTAVMSSYAYTDKQPFETLQANTLYYRLKMVDRDALYEYSKVVSVSANNSNASVKPEVYPNPFNEQLYISYTAAAGDENTAVEVRDITGKVVALRSVNIQEGSHTIQMGDFGQLKTGLYFVSIIIDGQTQIIKVIKQ